MKKLDIIIPHENLVDVNRILHKHGVGGMSFYDIKGRGRAKQEPVSVGRGVMTYVPEFGYRTKIEVVVSDALAKSIIADVLKLLGTGSSAIGKIFVYDVKEAYDLGTKEEGDSAL
ncbi:putative nitrogen regulatory protein P-II [Candidatus Nitrososphaera gargensis Ga9.2]|uniref:Putative nitrogen regulatory protein P-II n=1 Tax=Nitrososphaera gargensis (strain Ga9.2) TaxID=1237085 RepID=K0IGN8_NITGG|nr:P-II family nitrogen regulator [Candidatus Nitrososphaera gargensis]AFU58990.1 putative nitrogen regulatory protein P-II [Candidatus Nitrososphaera gargensis Ga9.2]